MTPDITDARLREIAARVQTAINEFDLEAGEAIARGERPDLWDPIIEVRIDDATTMLRAIEIGWEPIETAPEGVKVQLLDPKTGWVGTFIQKRLYADEDEWLYGGRSSPTIWNLLHYNGDVLISNFHPSPSWKWRPLPFAPKEAKMTPKYAVGDRVSFMGKLIDFHEPTVHGTITTIEPDERDKVVRYTVQLPWYGGGNWTLNEYELSPAPKEG